MARKVGMNGRKDVNNGEGNGIKVGRFSRFSSGELRRECERYYGKGKWPYDAMQLMDAGERLLKRKRKS